MLVDPYSKFFFVVSDLSIMIGGDSDPDRYCFLPYVRAIYVLRHHRRNGLQGRILEEMKDLSDDVGQSFSIVADPFDLTGVGREVTAHEAIRKFYTNDICPTEDYTNDLIKQRDRFLGAGLWNVRFDNAQITEPYQHFVYPSRKENEDNLCLFKENELNYIVNTKKIM